MRRWVPIIAALLLLAAPLRFFYGSGSSALVWWRALEGRISMVRPARAHARCTLSIQRAAGLGTVDVVLAGAACREPLGTRISKPARSTEITTAAGARYVMPMHVPGVIAVGLLTLFLSVCAAYLTVRALLRGVSGRPR